jgi:uncharacterized membrane protein required for colicin V production
MPFDLFCVGLVAVFALFGLFRGLVRQIFGLIGFAGGIVAARTFAQPFGDAFAKDLGLPIAVAVAALSVIIFLLVEILAKVIGSFLHGHLGTFTGGVDKLGGFLVGSAKGVLVAWVIASLVALLRPHLTNVERDTPVARLDLAHSQAVAGATSVNLVTQLRHPDAVRVKQVKGTLGVQ